MSKIFKIGFGLLWISLVMYLLICKARYAPMWVGDAGRDYMVMEFLKTNGIDLKVGHWMGGANFHYPAIYYKVLNLTTILFHNPMHVFNFLEALIYISFIGISVLSKKLFHLHFSTWASSLLLVCSIGIWKANTQAFWLAWLFFNIGFILLCLAMQAKRYAYFFIGSSAFFTAISISMSLCFIPVIPLFVYWLYKERSWKGVMIYVSVCTATTFLLYAELIRYSGGWTHFWTGLLHSTNLHGVRDIHLNLMNVISNCKITFSNMFTWSFYSLFFLFFLLLGFDMYTLIGVSIMAMIMILWESIFSTPFMYHYLFPIFYFTVLFLIRSMNQKSIFLRISFLLTIILLVHSTFIFENINNYFIYRNNILYDHVELAARLNREYINMPVLSFYDNWDKGLLDNSTNIWPFLTNHTEIYTFSNDSPDFDIKDKKKNFIFVCMRNTNNLEIDKCDQLLKKLDWQSKKIRFSNNSNIAYVAIPGINIDEIRRQ